MTEIEMSRINVEYHKVLAARLDLQHRIKEQLQGIKSLENNVAIQILKENELKELMKQEIKE
jgi:hypothetical protein